MPQSLSEWMNSERELPKQVIYGDQLLNKTVQRISLGDTVESTKNTGACAIWLIGSIVSGGFLIPLILWVGVINNQHPGSLDNICLGVIILAVLGAIAFWWFGNTRTREAKQLLVNPSPATIAEIQSIGAIEADDVQKDLLKQHVGQIVQRGGGHLRSPDYWMIDYQDGISSYTIGNTIFIKHEVLGATYLGAIIAYELARLHNGDGRIKVAVERLGIPQSELPYASEWRAYWRQQVFNADDFTVHIGYGREMLQYLKYYEPAQAARPYYEQEEPYITERIHRIERRLS